MVPPLRPAHVADVVTWSVLWWKTIQDGCSLVPWDGEESLALYAIFLPKVCKITSPSTQYCPLYLSNCLKKSKGLYARERGDFIVNFITLGNRSFVGILLSKRFVSTGVRPFYRLCTWKELKLKNECSFQMREGKCSIVTNILLKVHMRFRFCASRTLYVG